MALIAGLLHVPAVQRKAVLVVSSWAEASTGLNVELDGVHWVWWQGQIQITNLTLNAADGTPLGATTSLGLRAAWPREGAWTLHGIQLKGGFVNLDHLANWSASRPPSDGTAPAIEVQHLSIEDFDVLLPESMLGGGRVRCQVSAPNFTFADGSGALALESAELNWDAQGERPGGRAELRGVHLTASPHELKADWTSIGALGWQVSGSGSWPFSSEFQWPNATVDWRYNPAEGQAWWDAFSLDWGQAWWAQDAHSGQIHSTPSTISIPFATLPAGLTLAAPITVQRDAIELPIEIEGALHLPLDTLLPWLESRAPATTASLPFSELRAWLGERTTLQFQVQPDLTGTLNLRAANDDPRLALTAWDGGREADLYLEGIQLAHWQAPGPSAMRFQAHVTSDVPLLEAVAFKVDAALAHDDPEWPLQRLAVNCSVDGQSRTLRGTATSSGELDPFSIHFDGEFKEETWEFQWNGDLNGLQFASDWTLHGAWSGAVRRDAARSLHSRLSLRNLILLDGGRPTSFERLDLIGEWNGTHVDAHWESDLGTGDVHASTDASTWQSWWTCLQDRNCTPETPEFHAALQIRRFAPIALLIGQPIEVADGTRLEADSRNDGFRFSASSERIAYGDWNARGLFLQADSWNRDLYANFSADTIRQGDELRARNWSVDLHGDTLFAADVEWTGWGDAPTRLRFEAAPSVRAWNFSLYEASVPWLEDRLELVEVPAELTLTPGTPARWDLDGLSWGTSGARLDISGSLGTDGSDGVVIEATLNALPNWKGLEGWPVEVDSARITLEACDLLDELEWTAFGEIMDVAWGQAAVERLTWHANGDLNELSCWWEAGSEEQAFFKGSGRLPLLGDSELDLNLVMDGLPLDWINPLMPPGTVELQGGMNGWVRWSGRWDTPQLEGTLATDNAVARIEYLGVEMNVRGMADVRPDHFAFDQWTVIDDLGNSATLTGTILHKNLTDWNFDLSLDANRKPLHLLELTRQQNDLFYGSAFVRGDANVSGYANNLVVEARLESEPGTRFALPLDAASDARYADFISFKSPERGDEEEVARDLSRVRLDLALDIDEDAEARIIFDESVGDEITGRTRGALNLTIDDFERFSMNGQLEVVEGSYLFTLQNVINKRFTVLPGGTVTWFGDPYAAEIDLDARYEVRTALDPLLPLENELPGRAKVQLGMGLKGNLMRPEIAFGVDVPEVDTRIQALVESALINEEELNRQVMGLLVLQQFLSPDPTSAIGTTGLQEKSTEFLASQIGFWLSQMTREVNVGLDYGTSATSGEQALAVALSAQLLDDRLHVEGAVGTDRLFGGSTQDLQVQDIRIRYDLPPDGTFQVTGYTTSNPVITGQAGSTTQGVGLLMQSEFNSFRELWGRIWRRTEQPD
jgi:hypothetical protein